jgi:hypothetical protein
MPFAYFDKAVHFSVDPRALGAPWTTDNDQPQTSLEAVVDQFAERLCGS